MQAIILAAGMGRRLGEYTKDNTKCMLPVNGVRLIDRLLRQLSRLALQRVVIVVGYQAENLIDYIGTRYDDDLKIEYVHNPIYDKTNNIYSLSLAKEQLQEDDTLLIESDLIFDDALFPMIVNNPHPNVALVAKYETWMDGTMVCIDEQNNIINFVPKKAFRYEEVDNYYKTVNIYKFSADFSRRLYVPFLEAYSKALGNNEYYEQVLRVITFLDNADLKAMPIGDAKWYEIDDIQDLDIAETLFAEQDTLLQKYNRRFGGHWRFPKLLDFCYLVNPYFPTRQMKAEMKANFDTLLSEYPSGMYVNSLLAAKYFGIKQDYILVGNGAAELIKALMEQLTGNIGVPYPTFQEYPNRKPTTEIIGFFPDNADFSYTADDLMQFYADKAISALLLINPDNPSGNFIPVKDLHRLAAWCEERKIHFILDESFVDFSEDYRHNSLFKDDILEKFPHLILIKSISKSYGVPGLRLGVLAAANTPLIATLKREVAIWNINSFGEFYLQIYGKYIADYDRACQNFIRERARFHQRLQSIPFLRVIPSQANYFLCEVLPPHTAASLTLTLLKEHNVLIKDCNNKDGLTGRNYVRIAIRDQRDNDFIIDKLNLLV